MKKLIFLVMIVFILFSCSKKKQEDKHNSTPIKDRKKPLAWGHIQQIYVFSDENIWQEAEPDIRPVLEKPVFTTIEEKMFEITRVSHDKINDYFRFNNLIFYCDWSSDDDVSSYVKENLGNQYDKNLAEDGVVLLPIYNLWADDQLVMFIVGESRDKLLRINKLQAERIWKIYRDRLYKRVEYDVYQEGIKPLTNFDDQIWQLDIPTRYVVFREDKGNNFISYLGRSSSKPDRFIAVYHSSAKFSDLTYDWLVNKRNELADKYYEGDYIDPSNLTKSKIELAGRECLKISGNWINDTNYTGGAYTSFAFYDSSARRIFLIDNAVYYPEGYKLKALIELEVISNSISLK